MRKMIVAIVIGSFVLGFILEHIPNEARDRRRAAERRELEESAKLRRLQDSLDRSRRTGW